MTFTCAASPCRTIRLRTKKPSRCWSGRWGSTRAMRRRGRHWGRDIISTRCTAGAARRVFQRSNSAYERAVALDPNRVMAASSLITNRVERGELGRAYDAATDLVRRRPQSADAHFALSYVLRYAGMLDKSTQECNTARGARSGQFHFPFLRMVFPGDGQDRPGDGLCATGCRLGMGGVGNSLCVSGARAMWPRRSQLPKIWGRLRSYHRELMEACTAAPRPRGSGQDRARNRDFGDDGTGRRGAGITWAH